MTSEREKAELGAQTLKAFFEQFGGPNDQHSGVFLEILLEELMNAKAVSVFGKPQQTGIKLITVLKGTPG